MPSYPLECGECETQFEPVHTIPEYDAIDEWECPGCGAAVTKKNRIIMAANVTRASYVDGTKRKGFAEQREIHNLRKASYDLPHDKRKDINKTIKSIEKSGAK